MISSEGGGSYVRASCSIYQIPTPDSVQLCNSEIDCFHGEDIPGVYFCALYLILAVADLVKEDLSSNLPLLCDREQHSARLISLDRQTFLSEHFFVGNK